MSGYQPGACNIGPVQRRRRATIAAIAFALALGWTVGTAVGLLPEPVFVGVFVPLSIGFEWGLQAYTAFCVRLALLDRYDFRGTGGEAKPVTEWTDRRADDLQAAKLAAAGVACGAASTALLVVLV
ncbi:hypothetical protein [Halorhabdus salina]|uniref:hypothetical protein n=1 Tax=Halorhabdus salina TaxID=2750670 RepID=UPI0015EEB97B|nr:hypothetical protein [Halorhabdus salina]